MDFPSAIMQMWLNKKGHIESVEMSELYKEKLDDLIAIEEKCREQAGETSVIMKLFKEWQKSCYGIRNNRDG